MVGSVVVVDVWLVWGYGRADGERTDCQRPIRVGDDALEVSGGETGGAVQGLEILRTLVL